MTRTHVENIYKANGLDDYELRTSYDLLRVHGIDCKNVDGYNKLADEKRVAFERFIINLYNGFGVETRALIMPKEVYNDSHCLRFVYRLGTIEEDDAGNKWLHVTNNGDEWY